MMPRATPDSARRPRRRRWLLVLLLPIVGYYAGVHWLLNAGWVQGWLSDRSGMTIAWEAGHSPWPGRLVVSSLRIVGDDPASPLEVDIDRTSLSLSLSDLVAGHFGLARGTAEGLRTLRLGDYRLEGEGRLEVTGARLEAGRLDTESLALEITEAGVHRGREVLADEIRLETDLRLAALDIREPLAPEAARHLSGRVSLAATADAWDVFAPYMRQLAWLDLAGNGELSGELTLDRGVLAPGSELALDSPALRLEIDEAVLLTPREEDAPDDESRTRSMIGEAPDRHRLNGSGRIASRVVEGDDGPEAHLEVTLGDVVMQRAGLASDFMTSERFRLAATLPGTDLAEAPRRLRHASLEWREARLPDVGSLAPYLPAGGPLSLTSGAASLDGRLDYRDGLLDGEFHLAGEEVALQLLGQPLSGNLGLDLNLAELDPEARRLDLSGTRLRFAAGGDADDADLTTEVTLEEARLRSPRPLSVLVNRAGPPPLDGRIALRGRVGRLDVLDAFLDRVLGDSELLLEGDGELAASLNLQRGRVAAGSQLAVTTDALGIAALGLEARGRGSVVASWQPGLGNPRGRLEARLEETRVDRPRDGRRMMQGGELSLVAQGDLEGFAPALAQPTVELEWRGAEMPDVTVLQAYVPEGTPFRLASGSAATEGRLTVESGRARGRVDLSGRQIAGELFTEAFEGELSLALRVDDASLGGEHLDLTGSRLELRAGEAGRAAGERLEWLMVAREARLGPLPVPGRSRAAPASGELALEGMITNLGVLGSFLPAAHGLTLAGGGRFDAALTLEQGQLQAGSRLRVVADDLAVGFLDYEASGRGELHFEVEPAAENRLGDDDDDIPSARLALTLPRFDLRLLDEENPHVSGRHFRLETRLPRLHLERPAASLHDVSTRIRLPVANVDDLSRYNRLLPADAGLELLSGRAGLEADLVLEGLGIRGDVTLQAFEAGMRLADQRLTGDLRLEARLRDGDLAGRRFDASGSMLRLDNITREAADGDRDAAWWGRIVLEEGRLIWARPLSLEARLGLSLRDSGLLASLFLSRAREQTWLGRLLTVRDVGGSARLTLDDRALNMRDIRLEGGNLTLLADLRMRDDDLTGDFYARLGALGVGIALEDGDTDLKLWQPRRWFEQASDARRDDTETMVESAPDAWRRQAEAQRAASP
ncbi:MAG: hypothetical protein ACLFRS_07510 [Halomonas sp.]